MLAGWLGACLSVRPHLSRQLIADQDLNCISRFPQSPTDRYGPEPPAWLQLLHTPVSHKQPKHPDGLENALRRLTGKARTGSPEQHPGLDTQRPAGECTRAWRPEGHRLSTEQPSQLGKCLPALLPAPEHVTA